MTTPSVATQKLVAAQGTLNTLPPLLRTVHDPLSKAVARFHDVDARLQRLDSGLQSIAQFSKDLNSTLGLAGYLIGLLPGLAKLVANVINKIQQLPVLKTIERLANEIRTMVQKVTCFIIESTWC